MSQSSQPESVDSRGDRLWRFLTDNSPDPANPRHLRAQKRLDRDEDPTALFMVTLAVIFLVLYSFFVLAAWLPDVALGAIDTAMRLIWLAFIVDLTLRTALAPRHIAYLIHHPLDVIAVAIPAFRVLRVLRIFSAGQWLMSRGRRVPFARTASAVVFAAIFVTYIGSLAVLQAETNATGSSIKNFDDALWWALVTMSTVGYGELVPLTANGKIIAVTLMIVGISLLGLVGASVASSVITRLQGRDEEEQTALRLQITDLAEQIAILRHELTVSGLVSNTPGNGKEATSGRQATSGEDDHAHDREQASRGFRER